MSDTALVAFAMTAMLVAAGYWWGPRTLQRAWWKPALPVEATFAHIQPGDVLAIVDMQRDFLKKIPRRFRRQLIANVLAEIADARAIGAPIVLLALPLSDFGPTVKAVLRALKGYDLVWRATKTIDSGAFEIRQALVDHNYTCTSFRVCGMNTDMCVYMTAAILKDCGSVQVVVDACVTESSSYDWCEYVQYFSSRNIRRVRRQPEPSPPAGTSSPRWRPQFELIFP